MRNVVMECSWAGASTSRRLLLRMMPEIMNYKAIMSAGNGGRL